MEKIKEYASLNRVPIVRPKTLQILIDTLKECNPRSVLEIGTAIGFSGINILLNTNANLTTIEKYENMFTVAEANFKRFNLLNRVNMILGDAKDVLNDLLVSGKTFDFVFLDGPKGQYLSYLPVLRELLNDGGVIFADDVLFRGLVQGDEWPEHRKRTIVINLREYLKQVQIPPFSSQILDVEDGICITKKEKNNG